MFSLDGKKRKQNLHSKLYILNYQYNPINNHDFLDFHLFKVYTQYLFYYFNNMFIHIYSNFQPDCSNKKNLIWGLKRHIEILLLVKSLEIFSLGFMFFISRKYLFQ